MKKKCSKDGSITGWFIAILIFRFQYYNENMDNERKLCNIDENMYLIQSPNADDAYSKAMILGKVGGDVECIDKNRKKGFWSFQGINELIPIYDKIEDGAEILWTQHYCSIKTAKRLVKDKKELQAFQ